MSYSVKVSTKTPEPNRDNSSSQANKSNFSPSVNSPIDQILFLQGTVGNKAVEGLLTSGVIQAKLTIGKPGDIFEREADKVAEQVMRMPDSSVAGRKGVSEHNEIPSIQRMCTECEEELQRKAYNLELGPLALGHSAQEQIARQSMEEEDEELLQTKGVSGSTPEVTPSVESQINSVKGGGQPLPESIRTFFEPRFGTDFSGVRVHTDPQANESAKSVNALAYTLGRDVVFSGGQYSPGTEWGKKLIAHELAHVVQQGRGGSFIQRQPAESPDPTAFFKKMINHPNYMDNNIKKVEFFFAEMARIHYRDGLSFELGLVPKWMKAPFVEVDYHTPREEFRPIFDPKGNVGFFREADLANVPRSMPYGEMLKHYARPVEFFASASAAGRIIPSRVNMLTAPTLCEVLLDSERRFVEQAKWVAEWGTEVAKVVGGMGGGGLGGKTTAPLVKRDVAKLATREALSPTARKLAGEMDNLLKTGATKTITVEGMEFARVEVARQGSRLAVRRFQSKLPHALRGKGLGSRMVVEFEEAAVATARANGLKTVTIDVGIITNPGWREILEARGYVYTAAEGGWIKTVKL
jgi:hypothetical protein